MNSSTLRKNPVEKHWEQVIVSVNIDSMFASIEQLDHPEWRGRELGVTNDATGALLFSCSDEARESGIKNGMSVKDAKRRCPGLMTVAANYPRYDDVSNTVVNALKKISPELELQSVNQYLLDVTQAQESLGSPKNIAAIVAETIHEASGGLLCTIGIGGDKTTAQYASKQCSQNNIVIIPPWQAAQRLSNAPLSELAGISKSTAWFLARRGIHCCGDMKNVPLETLEKHFGQQGRRYWYMAQGLDTAPIINNTSKFKSISDARILASPSNNSSDIFSNLRGMCANVARKLEKRQQLTQRLMIAIRLENGEWIGKRFNLNKPSKDEGIFLKLCRELLHEQWTGQEITQMQLLALNPQTTLKQQELFGRVRKTRSLKLHETSCANDG